MTNKAVAWGGNGKDHLKDFVKFFMFIHIVKYVRIVVSLIIF